MANIKFGSLVSDVRGSIAGTTFSRGGGGAIVRNNPKPCNPRTPAQNSRRAMLAYLSQYWSKTLSAVNRDAWTDYAEGTSWTNKVGTQALISGLAAFVRLNTLNMLIGNPIRPAAPTQFGHAGTPTFTLLADGADNSLKIGQPSAPYVNNSNEFYMAFFEHSPVNAGHATIGGQRIYLGFAASSAGAPPAWPKTIISSYNSNNAQRMAVTGILIDPDFRLGGDYTAQAVAATP